MVSSLPSDRRLTNNTHKKRPHGDGLLVAGLFFTIPQLGEDPPLEDPGLCDPQGEPGWLSW